jgi:hypothetical protein
MKEMTVHDIPFRKSASNKYREAAIASTDRDNSAGFQYRANRMWQFEQQFQPDAGSSNSDAGGDFDSG